MPSTLQWQKTSVKIEKVENLKLVENLVKKYLLQESNRKLDQRKLS